MKKLASEADRAALEATLRFNNIAAQVLALLDRGHGVHAIRQQLGAAGVSIEDIERIDGLRFQQLMDGPADASGERRFRMPSFDQPGPRAEPEGGI